MPSLLLTQNTVSTYAVPTDKKKVDLFDTHTKGLMVEIRATGGKTYYLRYQNDRGITKQIKLADVRDVNLSQARAMADKTRNMMVMGVDPSDAKAAKKAIPKFGRFIADSYLPFVQSYKKSWETDVSLLKNHLLPRFERKYLDEITREDIVKMHASRVAEGAKPGSANRLLIMMRYIFNLALRWEVAGIKSNPTNGVPLLEENNKKERYLSVEEAQRLYEAVSQSENGLLKFIIPMLILTGARKREVLDAKWEHFDWAQRDWRIPDTKSGKARHVPLSDELVRFLASVPKANTSGYVFPNPKTHKPFVSIFYSWDTARNKAGLADVRIHDLRHSFASFLVNNGRTLYEVQKILGHTQVKTTQRYSHLSNQTLVDAANCGTAALGGMFVPKVVVMNESMVLLAA